MSELIERVAKALCPEPPDGIYGIVGDDGRFYPDGVPHWKAWEKEARTVLAAIRIPTEAMTHAAKNPPTECFGGLPMPKMMGIEETYTHMIDAELK